MKKSKNQNNYEQKNKELIEFMDNLRRNVYNEIYLIATNNIGYKLAFLRFRQKAEYELTRKIFEKLNIENDTKDGEQEFKLFQQHYNDIENEIKEILEMQKEFLIKHIKYIDLLCEQIIKNLERKDYEVINENINDILNHGKLLVEFSKKIEAEYNYPYQLKPKAK
jgi:hypothetical protein